MTHVTINPAQRAALYMLGRRLAGELLLSNEGDQLVVEHLDSGRVWLVSVEGALAHV